MVRDSKCVSLFRHLILAQKGLVGKEIYMPILKQSEILIFK